MGIRRKEIRFLLFFLKVLLFILVFEAKSQNIQESSVRGGFVVPEYDSKNRKRSVLYGDEALFLSNRIYLIKGLKIDVFNEEEKVIWTVKAPRCYFNYNNRTAFSDGELKLNSEDGQLTISGSGFEWRQSDSSLAISNDVTTTVRVLSRSTNAPKGTVRQEFEITGKKFLFRSRAFEADFIGDVKVREIFNSQRRTNFMNLNCDELSIYFLEKLGGVREIKAKSNVVFNDGESSISGSSALYLATNNTIILEGPVHWNTTESEGTANQLILKRTQDEFIALGNTAMRSKTNVGFGLHLVFPTAKNETITNGNMNAPIEITAGKIALTKVVTDGKAGRSFDAQTNVFLYQGENFIKTDHLLLIHSTNDVSLQCFSNTQWKTPDMIGKSKELVYSKKENRMSASGEVEIKLDLSGFQAQNSQTVSTNRRVVEVYGEFFSYHTTNIYLNGDARLIDNDFDLSCDYIFLKMLPQAAKGVFDASDNVLLRQRKSEKGYWILRSKYLNGTINFDKHGLEKIQASINVAATYKAKLTNNFEFEKIWLNCNFADFLIDPHSNTVTSINVSNNVHIVQCDLRTNFTIFTNLQLKCQSLHLEMDESGEFIKSGNAMGQVVLEKTPLRSSAVNQPIELRCEILKMTMQPGTNLVDIIEATQGVTISYGENVAYGEQAVYHGIGEFAELRRSPVLKMSPKSFRSVSGKPRDEDAKIFVKSDEVGSKKNESKFDELKTIEVVGAETLTWLMKENRFQAIGPYKLNISFLPTNTEKSAVNKFRK